MMTRSEIIQAVLKIVRKEIMRKDRLTDEQLAAIIASAFNRFTGGRKQATVA